MKNREKLGEKSPLSREEKIELIQHFFWDKEVNVEAIIDGLSEKEYDGTKSIQGVSHYEIVGRLADRLEIGVVLRIIPALILSPMVSSCEVYAYIPKEWEELYKRLNDTTFATYELVVKFDQMFHTRFYHNNISHYRVFEA